MFLELLSQPCSLANAGLKARSTRACWIHHLRNCSRAIQRLVNRAEVGLPGGRGEWVKSQ